MIYKLDFLTMEGMSAFRSRDSVTAPTAPWLCTKINVAPATARQRLVEVAGRDGVIDLTDAYGNGSFDNRKITITMETAPGYTDIFGAVTALQVLNGRELQMCESTTIFPGKIGTSVACIHGRLQIKRIDVQGLGRIAELEFMAHPFAQVINFSGFITNRITSTTTTILKITDFTPIRTEYPEFTVSGDPIVLRDANGANPVTFQAGNYVSHPYVKLAAGKSSNEIRVALESGTSATFTIKPKHYSYY